MQTVHHHSLKSLITVHVIINILKTDVLRTSILGCIPPHFPMHLQSVHSLGNVLGTYGLIKILLHNRIHL
jgi:hypothetical protein